MIKLLINITDLIKRLGTLSLFLLPSMVLVLFAVSICIVLFGLKYLLCGVYDTVVHTRQYSNIYNSMADKIKCQIKQ